MALVESLRTAIVRADGDADREALLLALKCEKIDASVVERLA